MMNKQEIKVRAYRKARSYMVTHGKNVSWSMMDNAEKVLFTYIRSINESILTART